ncbi:hypothetical protein R6Q57_005725, partial [Mikania cordata]
KVSVTGLDEKEEERSAGRSTTCSTSLCSSYFVPKTVFVGKFDEIKIKPNDMLKHSKKTFSKNCVPKLISSPLINQAAVANSTITKKTFSQLNPNCEPYVPTTSVEQMADLRFVPDHNMTAFLGNPPERHSEFKTLVDGLILSPSFWSTVTEHTDADGTPSIVGNIQGQPITITEQILREFLQFGDKAEDPVELDQDLVNHTVYQMGHEGAYPPIEKKLLHPYWRYLAHIVN